jgi:hypothetical protein
MKLLLLALCPVLLFSCTVTHIDSNKDPNFNKRIGVLHIIVRGTHQSDAFLFAMADYLHDELNKKGIKTTLERANPLSLESEKEMLDRVNKLNPDVLMFINQTESRRVVSRNPGTMIRSETGGATIDVKLFQPSSDKPVWRANCDSDSQTGQAAAGKRSAKKIIEKLIADQLIQ